MRLAWRVFLLAYPRCSRDLRPPSFPRTRRYLAFIYSDDVSVLASDKQLKILK